MRNFLSYLFEGGNIKVGDVSAAPFAVTEKSRASIQSDAKSAMSDLHDSFHKATGNHLFGQDKKALKNNSVFAGSTKHFMDSSISHSEFAKHKPTVGDFDVQIPKEHKDALASHLKAGLKLGNYTVAGIKKHGTEVSAVMTHKSGQHHQFDFEATDYEKDEPTKGEQFSHSADWNDTKMGIKGAHHKILLNAVGGDTHKFSITHGIRSRSDESDPGNKSPEHVSKTLFGNKADHDKVHSFTGVTELIKKHIPKENHQAIYDKFKESVKSKKFDNEPALTHLRKSLGVKDSIKESEIEHHVSVIPLVGFSPISHMGHAKDLGGALKNLPGNKHIGISSKADLFSPEERADILHRQWGQSDLKTHVVKSGGETIANAFNSMPKTGKKHLHILVGADRKDFAEKLKSSLEAGKIKEMGSNKFDQIHVHLPSDTERTHGMSGTNMRTAARDEDLDTFHKHLGSNFSKSEAKAAMMRIKKGIDTGTVKVKR
jgi:hypothetical protein